MSRYDNCSREELLCRIEELEAQLDTPKGSGSRFRERYACKILDSIPDMLTVLDRDGTLVELVSADETNHVGVPGGELAGQNIRTMLSPAACRNVKNNLDNVFATGCGSSSHHDITLDGRTRNYENRIFPLDGEHALCICRDITEAEAAKHELEMVKYALNNVDEEIYACSLDGTMEYANEQFRVRHDVEGDLSQHKVYDFWSYEGSRLQWEARLAKIRRDNGSHKYTVRFKNEQGRIVAWDIVAYIIYDYFQEREIVWFFGRDVTQRIEHENKVKEKNSILECILNNIPVYLFVKDPGNEFRYLYWNRAFEEYSRIPASRALGHTDYEIFPSPKDAEHFRQDDLTLLRTGERQTFIEEYVSATGETRIVNTSKSLVPVENRLPLIIGVSWDITDMKNAELEIVEARIRAEESDRLKSAFLANMSHEIRTPLNAIVGFSGILASTDEEQEKQEYMSIIESNNTLLLQLISDILDLSKIEAGTLEFVHTDFELNKLMREKENVMRLKTDQNVELVFEQRYETCHVRTDRNRLSQLMINLLTNAAKFTHRGSIRFGYELRAGQLYFWVADTGCGIPAERKDAVFERFVKLNSFKQGTGLGLSICRTIVEHLGGNIGVESEEGKGSTFWFTLPYVPGQSEQAEAPAQILQAIPTVEKDKLVILIAEDNESNYRLFESILRHEYKLVHAWNGREAVDLFNRYTPHLVLMDINMPVMDGYEATAEIRKQSADVPIIAVTAFAFASDEQKVLSSGFDGYMPKPINARQLKTQVLDMLRKRMTLI